MIYGDTTLLEVIPYLKEDYEVIKEELSTIFSTEIKPDIFLRQGFNLKDAYLKQNEPYFELGFITVISKDIGGGLLSDIVKKFVADTSELIAKAKHSLSFYMSGAVCLRQFIDNEHRDYMIDHIDVAEEDMQIIVYTRLNLNYMDVSDQHVLSELQAAYMKDILYSVNDASASDVKFLDIPLYTVTNFYRDLDSAIFDPAEASCVVKIPLTYMTKSRGDYSLRSSAVICSAVENLVDDIHDYTVIFVDNWLDNTLLAEIRLKTLRYYLVYNKPDRYSEHYKVTDDINLVTKAMHPQSLDNILDYLQCVKQQSLNDILDSYENVEIQLLQSITGDVRLLKYIDWEKLTEDERKYIDKCIKELNLKSSRLDLVKTPYLKDCCCGGRMTYYRVRFESKCSEDACFEEMVCCFRCLERFIESKDNTLYSFR